MTVARRPDCLDQRPAPTRHGSAEGEGLEMLVRALQDRIEVIDRRLEGAVTLERERDRLIAELERIASGRERP